MRQVKKVTEAVVLKLILSMILLFGNANIALAQHPHAENKTLTGCVATPEELVAGKPGDYGYLHELYHRCGTVEDLRQKTGNECCEGRGECRATYVNMRDKKVFLNGRWGDIGNAWIRYDVPLPKDGFSMVCASKENYEDLFEGPGPRDEYGKSFPYTFCIAVNTDS